MSEGGAPSPQQPGASPSPSDRRTDGFAASLRRGLRAVRSGLLVLLLVLTLAAASLGSDGGGPLGNWLHQRGRALIEARLASDLEATVRIERLELSWLGPFRLHGLSIERPAAFPSLQRLEVEEVWVEGRPEELLQGEIRRLELIGSRALTLPWSEALASAAPEAEAGAAPMPTLHHLLMPGLRVESPDSEPETGIAPPYRPTGAILDLDIHGLGPGPGERAAIDGTGGPWGRAELKAEAVLLDPFFAFLDLDLPSAEAGARPSGRAEDMHVLWHRRGGDLLLRMRAEHLQASYAGIGLSARGTDFDIRPTSARDLPSTGDVPYRVEGRIDDLRGSRGNDHLHLPELTVEARVSAGEPGPGWYLRLGSTVFDSAVVELLAAASDDSGGSEGEPREGPRAEPEAELRVRVEGLRSEKALRLEALKLGGVVGMALEGPRDAPSLRLDWQATHLGLPGEPSLRWEEGEARIRLHAGPRTEPGPAGEAPSAPSGFELPTRLELIVERPGIAPASQLATALPPAGPPFWPFRAELDGALHFRASGTEAAPTASTFLGRLGLANTLGKLGIEGRLATTDDGPPVDAEWTLEPTDLTSLLDFLAGWQPFEASDGPEEPPIVTARQWLDAGTVSARGSARGSWDRPRITLDASGELVLIAGKTGHLLPIDWQARSTLHPAASGSKRSFERSTLEHLRLAHAGLGRIELDGEIRSEADAASDGADGADAIEASLELRLDELHPERWRRELRSALAAADPVAEEGMEADLPLLDGYSLSGVGRADLRVQVRAGRVELSGPVDFDGLGFSSDDGARVLDGLDLDGELEASRTPDGTVEARFGGRTSGFLVLFDTAFGDFSQLGSELELLFEQPGSHEPAGPLATRASVRLAPDEGPRIELDLHPSPPEAAASGPVPWNYRLRIEDDALDSTYRGWLAPLFGEGADLRRLAGELALDLGGELWLLPEAGGFGLGARGHLRLHDLEAETGNLALGGFELDLPIDLRQERAAGSVRTTGPRLRGTLGFDRLDVAGLTVPPVASALDIRGDSVHLSEPLAIELLGGLVHLERFGLAEISGPGPSVESGLRFEALSLEVLSEALDLPTFEGRIDAHLPRIRLIGQQLEVDGVGRVSAFGGELRLREISGTEVLGDFPRLRFSAEVENLDLGQLTRRFDAGIMTGVLRGTVDDCLLVGGAPVSFDARFETVEVRGVSRTVDVKAVKNITILGTGGQASFFDRGIQRFLDSYRYSRLGVDIRLEDDVLLLRGLERRGDRELFLRGRFPFGIDVVNARPGQTVSFQTMMRRLGNLDFGGVRTE